MKEYFYLNEIIFLKVRNKLFLMYFIATALFGVLFSNISIILKCILCMFSFFLIILNWYRAKYILGLRKNPFEINFKDKKLRYFNEFRGNVFIDILNIRNMVFYSRNGIPYLIEVGIKGTNNTENMNTEGFDYETIKSLVNKLTEINPDILIKEVEKAKK